MENRIDRKNDENLNQPKIHSGRMRALYQMKQGTGKPMTVLVDQAIQDITATYDNSPARTDDPFLQKLDQETWEEIYEYRRFLDDLEYQRCLDELEKIKRNG